MNVNAIQTNVVRDYYAWNLSSINCQVEKPFSQSNSLSNFQHQNNPYSSIILNGEITPNI
jgi:hypothetical protein